MKKNFIMNTLLLYFIFYFNLKDKKVSRVKEWLKFKSKTYIRAFFSFFLFNHIKANLNETSCGATPSLVGLKLHSLVI